MPKENEQLPKPQTPFRHGQANGSKAKTLVEKKGFKRAEAATYLGVTAVTIDRLTKRGLLHPSRALRHPIYSRDDLDRFLRETSEPFGQRG
jgi:ribosomal protein S20